MSPKAESLFMRRIQWIYVTLFLLSMIMLSVFVIRGDTERDLNAQFQTLHDARENFDAGVLHVLLSDTNLSQWQIQIGKERFQQAMKSLQTIATDHVSNDKFFEDELTKASLELELLLGVNPADKIALSQQILNFRMTLKKLQTNFRIRLTEDLNKTVYWFIGALSIATFLVLGLFFSLFQNEKKRSLFHQQLASSQRHLSLITENIDEVFWLKDARTNQLLYVSSAFERLWELPLSQLHQAPDSLWKQVHPDDMSLVQNAMTQCSPEAMSLEYRILLANQHIKWVSARILPISADDGHGVLSQLVIIIETDITQTKLLHEQLSSTQKLESLGKLTGGIAHDFNNLLTVVMGNAQLIQDLIPADSPLSEIAALIVKAVERGTSLNRQLLAFASKQQMKPEKIDMYELLEEMMQLLRRTLRKSIRMEFNCGCSNLFCMVDAGLLQNAIINLCINAKDAMPSGGTISINLKLSEDKNFVLLQISDNGEGIDEKILPHIFEPFFTTKLKHKGSGLGLSMVYGFVQQTGGDIQVTTEKGVGTSFTLTIPVSPENLLIADTNKVPDTSIKSVLFVEDDVMVRESVLQMLKGGDYKIIVADNADQALDLINQNYFDIVFSDIVMPGRLNGIALADYVRQNFSYTHILLTSGFVRDLPQQYPSFSSYNFLPKPFSKAALLNALQQL